MKKYLFILSCLVIAACGDKGGSGGGGGGNPAPAPAAATTPLDASCLNGTTNCQTNGLGYSQYYQYGWRTFSVNPYYNQGWNNFQGNQARFCQCPVGYLPAYNSSLGLGCVSVYNVPSTVYQWSVNRKYEWNQWKVGYRGPHYSKSKKDHRDRDDDRRDRHDDRYDSRPRPSYTAPAPSYSQNNSGSSTSNCFDGLAQSCFVGQANTCANTGGVCVATASGSGLGVCTQGNLNNSNNFGGSISR